MVFSDVVLPYSRSSVQCVQTQWYTVHRQAETKTLLIADDSVFAHPGDVVVRCHLFGVGHQAAVAVQRAAAKTADMQHQSHHVLPLLCSAGAVLCLFCWATVAG